MKIEPRALLDTMSLEEKIGQLFTFGFPGKDPENAEELISDMHAGGIIYFRRNTGRLEETASLSDRLQDIALSRPPGIPLFICADQEGGFMTIVSEDIPRMPGPMALAAAGGPDLVEKVSRAAGTLLRGAGINMNLAPVLDVNDNPLNPIIGVRSFGSDPEAVSALGKSAFRGYLSAGVIPVGKHFPGHGNTSVDSHVDLPVITHSLEHLENVELAPFAESVKCGIPAIMTAHIVFNAVDPHAPATLSPRVLTGLLRQRLGFDGIVMTDCLQMAAISKSPGTPEGAVQALKAGCDVLLVCHTREVQRACYQAVLDAVRSSRVPKTRLNEAVLSILRLKDRMNLPNPISPSVKDDPALWELSRTSHLDSITVVRDAGHKLPLKRALEVVLAIPYGRGETSPGPTPLGKALAEAGSVDVREVFYGSRQTPEIEGNFCGEVVIVTSNPSRDEGQRQYVEGLLSRFPDAVLISGRDPYDIRFFPQAKTYICCYGYTPEAEEALAQVLLGRRSVGKLPVTLPETW